MTLPSCSHPGCLLEAFEGASSDLVYITEANTITAYDLQPPRDRITLYFCYHHWACVVKIFGHMLSPAITLRDIGWPGDDRDYFPEACRSADHEPKGRHWWIWFRRQEEVAA